MARQAVLLIHGIGEQRPMDTLRSFVESVWTADSNLHRDHAKAARVWSKPYNLSDDFELRRLTTAENKAGFRTDFFEFYWAHLMGGTKVSHVVAWARTLLLRPPWSVPRHLLLAYWVLLGLVAGTVAVVLRTSGAAGAAPLLPPWASSLIGLVVAPVALGILRNIVGDAARYLHVAPPNVRCRHEIRAAGVAVLHALHEHGYDRIIVVGHSLGSVIGYDILNYAWPTYNTDAPVANPPSYAALDELESVAARVQDGNGTSAADIQQAQRRYFNELRSNEVRWRVTDFVTLGSPLAHAEILLAHDRADLKRKIADRELPRCLPELEQSQHRGQEVRRFSYPPADAARVPHHAAVFAPTRWTNLYFPNRFLLWGDLVGGKLAPLFGSGVEDRPVRTRLQFGLLSHTLYWTPERGAGQHIQTLRAALDLLDERGATEVPDAGAERLQNA